MLSHITLGANDFGKALRFYDEVLAPLEISRTATYEEHGFAKYEAKGDPFALFICRPFDGAPASAGNGTHVAFLAKSAAAVDAFHAAAIEMGGTDEGQPGPRPHYHDKYYGAYVRDPDDNKLQACVHDYEG